MQGGYKNLNRNKYRERLSLGTVKRQEGLTRPKVFGYAASAIFTNCIFVENPTGLRNIYENQVKEVSSWFSGEWVPTDELESKAKNGKSLYADNPAAIAQGRRVTLLPKSDNPQLRRFHYADDKTPLHLGQRYTVIWTVNHQCFVL